MNSNKAKIAELNDQCRKSMGIVGRLIQTRGINSLPEAVTRQAIAATIEMRYVTIARPKSEPEIWLAHSPTASSRRIMGMAPRATPVIYAAKRLGGYPGGSTLLGRSGCG
jgi:hypothetical protein